MKDIILTDEQVDIIYSDINQDLYIEALAGTGKTTTLMKFCEANFDKNILYLVFSKDMRKVAKRDFPANVEVHTLNSFAYKYSKSYNFKVIDNINIHYIIQFSQILNGLYKDNNQEAYKIAIQALNALNAMLTSNYPMSSFKGETLDYKIALEIYSKMIKKEIPITHTALLKFFIDTHNFSQFKYDFILIDEAQDINPIMLKLIEKLNAKKIFVGDRKQAIFGFMQSINIFNSLTYDHNVKKLTKSFRFGSNIAAAVNNFMKIGYKDFETEINGMSDIEGIVYKKEDSLNIKDLINTAYITRTNAHLFETAFEKAKEGYSVSIPFNWEETKSLLLDIFFLRNGLLSKVKNSEIKKYKTYENFEFVLNQGGDIEFHFAKKIIEKYQFDIIENIEFLEKNLSSPKFSNYIFITAHKSKGLEFFNVIIGEDFKEIGKQNFVENEELNLLYVALTRPMEILQLNSNLSQLIL